MTSWGRSAKRNLHTHSVFRESLKKGHSNSDKITRNKECEGREVKKLHGEDGSRVQP